MAVEASRWVSQDEAADLLGLSPEATKRLALRRGHPRRMEPSGGTLVAVPDALSDGGEVNDMDLGRGGARSPLDAHVERLTEKLVKTRTEMCGVRYEAESLRIEAGRAQVLAALVEAERGRSAEVKAELAEHRRPWIARALWSLFERGPARRRRRAF